MSNYLDAFENIKIITDTADIDFVLSENLNTLIICEEHKNIKHSVNVKENTLLVEVNDNRKWYEYIGIFVKIPKITNGFISFISFPFVKFIIQRG